MAREPVARLIDRGQILSIDVLGAKIEFQTEPEARADEAPCVMRGILAPGIVVPLHSHADPETFILTSGVLEGLSFSAAETRWIRLSPGDIFHVPGHAKHAFRNFSDEPAVLTIVSTNRMGCFFREAGQPAPIDAAPLFPPAPEAVGAFLDLARKYGHWNANPAENAAVDLQLDRRDGKRGGRPEPDREPFFAIVGRDGAQFFAKAGEAAPLPNPKRDPAMRWDAYVLAPDPDALAAEFVDRGVVFSNPLKDTHDGLRGFEITDPDGYVLFFGRPR